MKPVVIHSEETPDGTHCIDIRREGAAFTAALCRRDPEDPHGWRILQVEPLPGATADTALGQALRHCAWDQS